MVTGIQGGNSGLSEETAKTWTVGIALTPQFFRAPACGHWYDIKLTNAITAENSNPSISAALCVDQPTLDNPFCDSIDRANGGVTPGRIIGFRSEPVNVGRYRTSGLDINLNYRLDAGKMGRFN